MDLELSILVSSGGYIEIDHSLSFSGTVFYIVLTYLFRFQLSIHLSIVLSSSSILSSYAMFLGLIM